MGTSLGRPRNQYLPAGIVKKDIQIGVLESGHAAAKNFNETVEFKMFLKITLSHIFLS